MSTSDQLSSADPGPDPSSLERLLRQILQRWREFPPHLREALELELGAAIAVAMDSPPELLTVAGSVSRPQHLRLGVLVADEALDTMYGQDRAELSVSDRGLLYLVYRLRDGGDYATEWSPAAAIPATMMDRLSEPLATALLGGDEE